MVDGKAWGTVIENSTRDKENIEDLNKNIVQFNNATAGPGIDRIFDLIRLINMGRGGSGIHREKFSWEIIGTLGISASIQTLFILHLTRNI